MLHLVFNMNKEMKIGNRSLLDLFVEEGRLPCGGKQPLPVLLLGPQAVLISAEHLLDRNHCHSVLQMPNREVSVPTHQAVDAAKGDLAE